MTAHDTVLVVDFGAQYAQLIARRVREAKVYSEIVPHTMPVEEMLAKKPTAIILSGGPSSVYEAGRAAARPGAVRRPGAGLRHLLRLHGDGRGARRHRGAHRAARVRPHPGRRSWHPAPCSTGSPSSLVSWMSHGDEVVAAPEGFTVNARSPRATVAAFEDVDRRLAGVQWHPEVMHTEHGQAVLEHFLHDIAGCRPTWTMVNIVEEQVERIRAQIGDDGRAICGLSGGVDSAVAARCRPARDRRPADLRVRRPRPAAQGRGRAGRARLRGRHRGRPARGGRREAVPRRAGRGQRPRGEAQGDRARVHPGLRGRRGRRARGRRRRRPG